MAVGNLKFLSFQDIFKIYNDSKRSLLKDINENIDGYDIRFHSREYSSDKPYLDVTYTLTMKKYYYIKDHLGSIRSVIDGGGDVMESYDYYPFGLKMPNRTFVSGTGSKNLFNGKERDDETGWDYFGARYYRSKAKIPFLWDDPAVGRWLTVDSIAEKYPSKSPYNYCSNNPIALIDPNGMCEVNKYDTEGEEMIRRELEELLDRGERNEMFWSWWKKVLNGTAKKE